MKGAVKARDKVDHIHKYLFLFYINLCMWNVFSSGGNHIICGLVQQLRQVIPIVLVDNQIMADSNKHAYLW